MYSLGSEPYDHIPPKQLKTFITDGHRMDKPTYASEKMYLYEYLDFFYKLFLAMI